MNCSNGSILNWFKVEFSTDGRIESCSQVEAPTHFTLHRAGKKVIFVQELDLLKARKQAELLYASQKKKKRGKQLQAQGNCVCGRKQNRINPQTGEYMKTCTVCVERQDAARARAKAGKAPGMANRDEGKRIESLQSRIRDRKNEMRIETLLEVRNAWQNARNNGIFTQWLEGEIKAATVPRLEIVK